MRRQGTIISWKDNRGFGFIAPAGGGKQVFVHISSFSNHHRPSVDAAVTYRIRADAQGRPHAYQVMFVGEPTKQTVGGTSAVIRALTIGFAFLALVAGLAIAGKLPALILLIDLVASAIAFAVYAWDKSAARKGRWRTTERALHVLGVLGGWPGALIARHVFLHKSRKQAFINVFWGTVVLNCVTLGLILSMAD